MAQIEETEQEKILTADDYSAFLEKVKKESFEDPVSRAKPLKD